MLKYTISEHLDLVSDETAPEYLRGAGENELSEIYVMCSTAGHLGQVLVLGHGGVSADLHLDGCQAPREVRTVGM